MTGPSMDDLRRAGVELQIDQLREELESSLSTTWRGRLVLRLSRLWARWRTWHP